jgi:acyl-coenzyme A synthetase/AMP-(fatty) acid ligase
VPLSTLWAWTRQERANYKVPRYLDFVESLPLNATGKLLKMELRVTAAEMRAD